MKSPDMRFIHFWCGCVLSAYKSMMLGHRYGLITQANASSEQVIHHALLYLAGFGEFGFQGSDLGIHVGEDSGDGGLFFNSVRRLVLERNKIFLVKVIDS